MGKKPSFGAGFWVRFFLVITLLFFGLWQANQVNLALREARRQALGLGDNNGRIAWIKFKYPFSVSDEKPFPVVLVYHRDYQKYAPLASVRNLGIFTYMGRPSIYPVRLAPPYRQALFLSGHGIIVETYFCRRGPCLYTPKAAYSALVEIPWELNLVLGGTLEVLSYGEWLKKP